MTGEHNAHFVWIATYKKLTLTRDSPVLEPHWSPGNQLFRDEGDQESHPAQVHSGCADSVQNTSNIRRVSVGTYI